MFLTKYYHETIRKIFSNSSSIDRVDTNQACVSSSVDEVTKQQNNTEQQPTKGAVSEI